MIDGGLADDRADAIAQLVDMGEIDDPGDPADLDEDDSDPWSPQNRRGDPDGYDRNGAFDGYDRNGAFDGHNVYTDAEGGL